MNDTVHRMLDRLAIEVAAAARAARDDRTASPVTAAVIAEFERKFDKSRHTISGVVARAAREAVVELEQAADSAKYAAQADAGANEATRRAVVAAHDTICYFKATGQLPPESAGQ